MKPIATAADALSEIERKRDAIFQKLEAISERIARDPDHTLSDTLECALLAGKLEIVSRNAETAKRLIAEHGDAALAMIDDQFLDSVVVGDDAP